MTSADQQILSTLKEVVNQLLQGRKVNTDIGAVPESETPEIQALKSSIALLASQYNQSYDFILAISRGELEVDPPHLNSFATPFKQLQADLKHLTWQIQQISEGDLEQKVYFSGDFSSAINRMIDSLREKQRISELNEKYLNDLKELNASKDKLFSIIAHDLKNPFSGLLNLSDMILNDYNEHKCDDIGSYATLLKAYSIQGYKLLINLLDWAKVQSNSILINIEPLLLAPLAKNSQDLIESAAIPKNITIDSQISEKLHVLADSNMLQTVLRNLLSNAVKFTPIGGSILLSAQEEDGRVLICVRDNGVGIEPENLKKLFRIDSNFSTNGTDNEMGTGLGLILCMDYLKKMDSEIQVESEVGQGTTFSFSLPMPS